MDTFHPIIFLGISQHVKSAGIMPPVTPIDIFCLTKQSVHIIYPIPLKPFQWVFLINSSFLKENIDKVIKIEMRNKENRMIVSFGLSLQPPQKEPQAGGGGFIDAGENLAAGKVVLTEEPIWFIQPLNVDASLELPGVYDVYFGIDQANILIDRMHFLYQKVPPFTSSQIKAFESDPFASKVALLELACKHCPSRLKAYTAFNRIPEKEKQGYIWQYELPDEFVCSCGKTIQKLTYIKEGMHGLLGRDKLMFSGEFNYESRYSYSGTMEIINKFNSLLEKSIIEEDFQKFLDNNPILLAKYHAKKMYFKPDISGKFKADIVLLNTQSQLVFIELEPPDTPLFKKDGHPTAELNHAYGQIVDWMEEYRKSPNPLLDRLGLKPEEVNSVKGAVIVGKRSAANPKHFSRHMANPAYPDIEFLTYDGLVESLAHIARAIGQKSK